MTATHKTVKVAADKLQKLAQIEAFDRQQAFELGFAKVAHELGLSEEEYSQFYHAGVVELEAQNTKA